MISILDLRYLVRSSEFPIEGELSNHLLLISLAMSTSTTIPEESQLHLKRNRACLRCKKRKIKCDGVGPLLPKS